MADDDNWDGFTPAQLTNFKDAFQVYDEDNDGQLVADDVVKMMRSLGYCLSGVDAQEIVADLDIEKDGVCNFDYAVAMLTRYRRPAPTETELRDAFKALDSQRSGAVSASALRHVMASLGERLTQEELAEFMQAADTDGNGQIDYQEFVAMMASDSNRKATPKKASVKAPAKKKLAPSKK